MLVFITTYEKKQSSCIGMIDVYSIGKRLKKQNLGGETICEEGVDIRGLCQFMPNEGVNISWEFTNRKYHIVAQIVGNILLDQNKLPLKT